MLLFRGLKLYLAQINDYIEMIGKFINMPGFMSTSTSQREAILFASKKLQPGQQSVLMQIKWNNFGNHFRLNSDEFTAHKYEEEVLIEEGYNFFVTGV